MLKEHKNFLLLSLAAILVFLCVENLFVSSFQQCVSGDLTQGGTNYSDYNSRQIGAFFSGQIPCSVDLLDTHAGLLAALSGFIVALFTYTLWRSTDNLWEAGEKQRKISERALTELETPFLYPHLVADTVWENFIDFERYDHPTSPVPSVTPRAEIRIKNHGRTPALLRSIGFFMGHEIDLRDHGLDELFSNDALEFLLTSRQETADTFIAASPLIDKAEYTRIKAGHVRLLAYGTVWYADIFGNEWTQTFAFRWDPKLHRFGATGAEDNQRKRRQPES